MADKRDPSGKPEKSKFAIKSRRSLESTHDRHQPKVYGCTRCYSLLVDSPGYEDNLVRLAQDAGFDVEVI